MKLLCAADLHLGRQPSRLAGPVHGLLDELSASVAWQRLVDVAIDRQVTAVLLAGDVLDDEHDYFEAFGELKAGVERLVSAGIAVLAVSGNHDVEVLPRLAQAVHELVLLGEGGVWQAETLKDDSGTVHVVGWSYPTTSVTYSPLASLPAALEPLTPAPVLGLLHCDRDQSGSRYAPVTSAELAGAAVDAWLLGHVHRPDAGARGGYLGSVFAADPGEEGARGAWLVEVDAGSGVTFASLPLSPLRFETLTLDVSERRFDGAQQKRALQANSLERLPLCQRRQALHVNDNVGVFRHLLRSVDAPPPNGSRNASRFCHSTGSPAATGKTPLRVFCSGVRRVFDAPSRALAEAACRSCSLVRIRG